MNRILPIRAMLASVCLAASSNAEAADIPTDCSLERLESVQDVSDLLSHRSVQITWLAEQDDTTALARLVLPNSNWVVWEGDNGVAGGTGTEGALHFAKRIRAAEYQFAVVFPGPVSTDICASQEVTVWLTQADGQSTYVAVFKYLGGRLVKAVAKKAQLSKGVVGQK